MLWADRPGSEPVARDDLPIVSIGEGARDAAQAAAAAATGGALGPDAMKRLALERDVAAKAASARALASQATRTHYGLVLPDTSDEQR